MSDSNNAYIPKHILALEGREHVRKRPGMYIGGTESLALHHMVYEVLDHMVEEAFVGRCNHIWLTLLPDNWVTIRDNSLGLPIEPYKDFGLTVMEALLQHLIDYKSAYEPDIYRVTGGLHGVGLAVVNMVSAEMKIENARDGFLWRQSYREGIPQTPLEKVRPLQTDERGTMFSFVPDFSLLQPNPFDYDRLAHRCREIAYQVSGLSITIRDERVVTAMERTYATTEGLKSLIQELNAHTEPLHEIVHVAQELTLPNASTAKYSVEFAFQFTTSSQSHILSFVNTVETTSGGTHLEGLKAAILSVLNEADLYPDDDMEDTPELTWKKVSRGLSAVISVRHANPVFQSPTKALLGNTEIYGPVAGLVYQAFTQQVKTMHYKQREALGRHFFRPPTSNSPDSAV
ncbi:MAG: hypothetical protein BroJett018_51690 [Chloroflexota bacterium]|nr:hypothetical protein [Chloroflexota bacterium]NOG66028.1 hypothetical protein [Chloroflexota bacterium]GIK67375.1 MAG: hypothetical protein BroJett018_51690 [Chloroflexota bacterium]